MTPSRDETSPLLAKLRRLIEADGPVSVAEYMSVCLCDPSHGYYMKQDPFGRGGDFITAPEISQLFGELVGAWLIDTWRRMGAPAPVSLVEAGPGRGTLMSDILRVATHDQAFSEAARLHMVEISPALKARQQETLRAHGDRIEWHESFETIPDDPVLIVANEFFDALPVRQYVGHGERWQERRIGLADDRSLAFTLGPRTLGTDIKPVEDAVLEVSPLSTAIVNGWAERIGRQGGAALIIDYGHTETAVGETLQAVRAHEYVEVLADPGDADLTAHVDFAALRTACEGTGAICHGPMAQGDFLLALGLLERAGQLGRDKDDTARQVIRDAIERLAGPDQMGHLFKVLAVTGGDFRPLPFSGD